MADQGLVKSHLVNSQQRDLNRGTGSQVDGPEMSIFEAMAPLLEAWGRVGPWEPRDMPGAHQWEEMGEAKEMQMLGCRKGGDGSAACLVLPAEMPVPPVVGAQQDLSCPEL